MPDIVLTCGQTVVVDDEDYDFVASKSWYVRRRQDRPITIIHDEYRGGRRFRVFLHRAIAVRMKPDLIPIAHYLRIRAKNGDFSDVRRTNLQILVSKRNPGSPKRKPEGWVWRIRDQHKIRGTIHERDIPTDASPLWTGGLVKSRSRRAPGGRHHILAFAGRTVVGEDGLCRGGVLGDHERRHDGGHRDDQGRGGDPDRDAALLVLGEDEGG